MYNEGEEIKDHKCRGNVAREAPKLLETKGMGRAREPDYAAEGGVACCSQKARGKQNHEKGDEERRVFARVHGGDQSADETNDFHQDADDGCPEEPGPIADILIEEDSG